jgi:hypothetical protein
VNVPGFSLESGAARQAGFHYSSIQYCKAFALLSPGYFFCLTLVRTCFLACEDNQFANWLIGELVN